MTSPTVTVGEGRAAFAISTIELLALKKLEVVGQALASQLSGTASREMKCLADTLHDVVTRYQIAATHTTTEVGEGTV